MPDLLASHNYKDIRVVTILCCLNSAMGLRLGVLMWAVGYWSSECLYKCTVKLRINAKRRLFSNKSPHLHVCRNTETPTIKPMHRCSALAAKYSTEVSISEFDLGIGSHYSLKTRKLEVSTLFIIK